MHGSFSLYRPHGTDRVAYIVTEPSIHGGVIVKVSRGPKRVSVLTKMHGPFDAAEAESVAARELAGLRDEGFAPSGLGVALAALDSKKRKKRALAAVRLGWMREAGAVEPLLLLAQKANEELPVIVDTLGEIHAGRDFSRIDPRVVALARATAERKLLSRRRAGVEALWRLSDKEGLADAKNRALERLPKSVADALAVVDLSSQRASDVADLVAVVSAIPIKDRGLAMDTLYELRSPLTVEAVRAIIPGIGIDKPHVWRYAKSVLKRAMLRYDFVTFGLLAHGVESLRGKTPGTTATLKSGFDGETKSMRVFGRATQAYVVRSLWRYLSRLARYRAEWFALGASEALIHYRPEDEAKPNGLMGRYSSLYLFSRIAFGSSPRFAVKHRTLKMPFKSASLVKPKVDVSEEAFPALFRAAPASLYRLLSAAKLPVVHEIALRMVRREPELLHAAPNADVVLMVGATYKATVEVALAELQRRFDPEAPDMEILRCLLVDKRADVRTLGLSWLEQSRSAWARSPHVVHWIMNLLEHEDAEVRALSAEQAARALEFVSRDAREELARRILEVLVKPEPEPGAFDSHGRVGQLLASEIAALVTIPQLFGLLARGGAASRAVAMSALVSKEGAANELGADRLIVLASDEQALVRQAAFQLLRELRAAFDQDPSPLFALLELPFADARQFAKELLTGGNSAELSLDVLLGLCDSNLVEAQDVGKSLVESRLAALAPDKLITALTQHPHKNIQRFALGLVLGHLQAGFVKLSALETFFRAVLLDAVPDRKMKRSLMDFLGARGVLDENQAAVCARLLTVMAKSQTKFESERALTLLTQIKLRYPAVETVNFTITEVRA